MATTLTPALIEQFRSSLIARGRSDLTVKAYTSDLKSLLQYSGGPVTDETFDNAAVALLNHERRFLAPKTVDRRHTALRTFARLMKWPCDQLTDYHTPQPGRAMPHPIPEGVSGVYAMIDQAQDARRKALIALCGLCGLRVAEALSITPKQVSIRDKTITVRGKGDKTRTVPVSDAALRLIVPAMGVAVLDGTSIVNYKDRFARQVIADCAAKAKLSRPVSSHDLRATFATAVYDKTKDIRVVQELLGHSSSQTTEGYTGVAADAMRRAVEL
jgi:site-specific recombinase XerD